MAATSQLTLETIPSTGEATELPPNIAVADVTREDWLVNAARLLRPLFLENDIVLPNSFRIACGWPLSGQQGSRGGSHAIGQYWAQKAGKDGNSEIFIFPVLDEARAVAAVLVHELVHATERTAAIRSGPHACGSIWEH